MPDKIERPTKRCVSSAKLYSLAMIVPVIWFAKKLKQDLSRLKHYINIEHTVQQHLLLLEARVNIAKRSDCENRDEKRT